MIVCDRHAPAHYTDTERQVSVPSVSQVLEVLYGDRFRFVDRDVLAVAQERGTRRHLLFGVLLLWRAGLAAYPTIDARDEAVGKGLVGWIEAHNVRPLRVEEPGINLADGYGGTPDCQALLGPRSEVCLLDLKSGVEEEAHGIQLQAYLRLHGYENTMRMIDVYVSDEGAVKETLVHPNAHDWAWFLNALGVLKGRLVRGVTR